MDNCQRTDPPSAGTEKDVLQGFLGYLRDTMLCKLDGLTDEELRRPHDPSGLTLLGMVKHLTDVESSWFRETFLGEQMLHSWDPTDPDKDWRIEQSDTTAAILDGYRAEIRKANEIVDAHPLDAVATSPRTGMEGLQLRWIVTHLIEETARHCGHADLIREAIDGQTGE